MRKFVVTMAVWCAMCLANLCMADGVPLVPSLHFRWQPDHKLVVTYQMPRSCADGLRELDDELMAPPIRAKRLPVESTQGAVAARFEVPLSTDAGEAQFPWAHPVGERGVYLYLGHYSIPKACGQAHHTFDAPGVMLLQGMEPGPVKASAEVVRGKAVVLFDESPAAGAVVSLYVDPAFDAVAAQTMQDVFLRGRDFFKRALPNARYSLAGMVIGATQDGGDVMGFGGDANNIIRLHVYNLPPARVLPQLKLTTLHELAHRFHPEEIANSTLHPLPGEGGADFLRWWAAYQLQLINKAEAADMFDAAMDNCLRQTGIAPWLQLGMQARYKERASYDCGMVVFALGLALRQGSGTAMARVDDAFASLTKPGAWDFAQQLECGRTIACAPQWLPRLLGSQESVNQVAEDLVAQTDLLRRVVAPVSDASTSSSPCLASANADAPGCRKPNKSDAYNFRVNMTALEAKLVAH